MNCNGYNAKPLNYCGGTLYVGTTTEDGPVQVVFQNAATGTSIVVASTETVPDVEVELPALDPDQVYKVYLYEGDFTPIGSVVDIPYVFVKFSKFFDADGEVVTADEQTLEIE